VQEKASPPRVTILFKVVEKDIPKELDLHIIADNYATQKHQKVKNWLKRHKPVTLLLIPTSSSWLDLVERFFGLITDKAILRDVFSSVKDPQEKLMQFIENYNHDLKPFKWTNSTENILEKVAREKAVII